MNTQDNYMSTTDVGFSCPKSQEVERLEKEIRIGFEQVHKNHTPDFKWKNILMLGSMIALIGAAETFREPDKKWYSFPLSLLSAATMGYAFKLTDKKDLLKLENNVLHKVLDFPLYQKESAYRSKFMQAVEKTGQPIKTMTDFDSFSDNEKFQKRDVKIGCFAIVGVNAAITYAFSSIPLTFLCIGATMIAGQGMVYRKHIQNRKLLKATLPLDVQIPQMNERTR